MFTFFVSCDKICPMKKYILSALLLGTFGTYAVLLRSGNILSMTKNTEPPTNSDTISGTVGVNSGTSAAQEVLKPRRSFWSEDDEGDDDDDRPRMPTVSAPATPPAASAPAVPNPTASSAGSPMMGQGSMMNTGMYKNGTYTGTSVFAYDAYLQAAVTISGGKITDVTFPVYPNRGESRQINAYAMPIFKQEAISAQNANVATVSGATYSSDAFRQSLSSALALAKN